MNQKRTLQASEVSSYLFCKRAWWYQLRGVKSQNQTLMEGGQDIHRKHGIQVVLIGFLRLAAGLVFLGSSAMLTVYLTRFFL